MSKCEESKPFSIKNRTLHEPFELHGNHTFVNSKAASALIVDLQVPSSAQKFHVQRTANTILQYSYT